MCDKAALIGPARTQIKQHQTPNQEGLAERFLSPNC